MTNIIFEKQPINEERQLSLLQSEKGIIIHDYDHCKKFLSKVSYYKLSGYWLHKKNKATNKFSSNTALDDIIKTYELDLEIKQLILVLLNHYETSLKTNFINLSLYISNEDCNLYKNSHFYLSKKIISSANYEKNLEDLQANINKNKSKLPFISWYQKKYDFPEMPPIWMVTELMTFGDISRWVKSIIHDEYVHIIPNKFGFHDKPSFDNINYILTNLRNICAHNGRVFNNNIYGTRQEIINVAKLDQILDQKGVNPKLWNSIVLAVHGLHNCGLTKEMHNIIRTFDSIFEDQDYSQLKKSYYYYGFPPNWRPKLLDILT